MTIVLLTCIYVSCSNTTKQHRSTQSSATALPLHVSVVAVVVVVVVVVVAVASDLAFPSTAVPAKLEDDLTGFIGNITVSKQLYHTIPYHTIPYHTIPYHTIDT